MKQHPVASRVEPWVEQEARPLGAALRRRPDPACGSRPRPRSASRPRRHGWRRATRSTSTAAAPGSIERSGSGRTVRASTLRAGFTTSACGFVAEAPTGPSFALATTIPGAAGAGSEADRAAGMRAVVDVDRREHAQPRRAGSGTARPVSDQRARPRPRGRGECRWRRSRTRRSHRRSTARCSGCPRLATRRRRSAGGSRSARPSR